MGRVNGFDYTQDRKILIQTTGVSSYVTGTVILSSVLIPANTFAVNDVIQIEHVIQKSGTSGTLTWRYYYNTSNSLTGATQLAVRGEGSTNVFLPGMRKMAIRSTTNNTFICNTAAGFYTDFQTITSAPSTVSLNWTVDSYIILSMQGADNARTLYLKVTN